MSGEVTKYRVAEAWSAAVAVASVSYGVRADAIHAEGMGRGYRPPAEARIPKKIAIFLAVTLSGSDYAELGRHLALHRDTIASHCDDLRQACAVDAELEARVDALLMAAAGRLGAAPRKLRAADEDTARALLLAVHARFDRIEATLARFDRIEATLARFDRIEVALAALARVEAALQGLATVNPTMSGFPAENPTGPDYHGNVIERPRAASGGEG